MPKQSILIIDEEKDTHEILFQWAEEHNYRALDSESIEQSLCILNNHNIDIVLANFSSSQIDAISLDEYLLKLKPDALIIFLLPGIKELNQVKNTLQSKLYDYLIHPVDFDQLTMSLNRALEYKALEKKYLKLKKTHSRD